MNKLRNKSLSKNIFWIVLYFVTVLFTFSKGKVVIHAPYYPFYVEYGSDLSLFCNTAERFDLEWVRQTPSSGFSRVVITPVPDEPFIIRSLSEEPSGYRESTLIIQNVSVEDRSTYWCRDETKANEFSVYITVLEITALSSIAEETEQESHLLCNIMGFDTNPPPMKYVWYYNGEQIPTTMHKYSIRITEHAGMSTSNLFVRDSVFADTGTYTCEFILGTNMGDFKISKDLYLNAEDLGAGSSSASSTYAASTVCPMLLIVTAYQFAGS